MPLLRDDPRLREAFRRGDSDALARVYKFYVQSVAGLLRAGFTIRRPSSPPTSLRLSDAFELENTVQEVFVRLMSTHDARPGNVRAWLFAAVRNAAAALPHP